MGFAYPIWHLKIFGEVYDFRSRRGSTKTADWFLRHLCFGLSLQLAELPAVGQPPLENVFTAQTQILYLRRGGGVVNAPASRSRKQRGQKPEKGKIAGGLRARRGSNPFPGAINILLDKPPAVAVT